MEQTKSIFDFLDVYDQILRAPLEQIETEVNTISWLWSRMKTLGIFSLVHVP